MLFSDLDFSHKFLVSLIVCLICVCFFFPTTDIRVMPMTLDRMCGRSPGMDRVQAIAALGQGTSSRSVGWLAFSSAVMTGRHERDHDSLFEGVLLSIVQTNSPTSVRLGDDFWYISVWAIPANRLVF